MGDRAVVRPIASAAQAVAPYALALAACATGAAIGFGVGALLDTVGSAGATDAASRSLPRPSVRYVSLIGR